MNMSKYNPSVAVVIATAVSLWTAGCGGSSTPASTTSTGTLNSTSGLTVSSIAALAVTSGGSSDSSVELGAVSRSATSFGSGQLLSMDSSGNLSAVNIFSNSVTAPVSLGAYTLPSFIALPFQATCSLVLLRSSDGALFCGETAGLATNSPILSDTSGNAYYRVNDAASGGWDVNRVILTNPASPQKVQINTASEAADVQGFVVNSVGDVALSLGFGGLSRVAQIGGGSTNFSSANTPFVFNDIPGSNNFWSFEYPNILKSIVRNATTGNFTVTTVAAGGNTTFTGYPANAAINGGSCATANDVFILNAGTVSSGSDLHRIVNNQGTVGVASAGFASVQAVLCGSNGSANVVYVQGADSNGNSMLQAYSYTGTSTGTWSNALGSTAAGTFTIYTTAIQTNGSLLINALQNNTGATVGATIAAGGGTPTVISTSFPKLQSITVLE